MHSVINGIHVWGDVDHESLQQAIVCKQDADKVSLMADHHVGYAVPIGGVVAYKDHVSPSGVGFDIACGNKSVRLDACHKDVTSRIENIMDSIHDTLSFGVGHGNKKRVDDSVFDSNEWDSTQLLANLKDLAYRQFGSIGSGNHYVDIMVDACNHIWIGVHFGSRGLGHKIATHYLELAGGKDGIHVKPALLDIYSEVGQEYIHAMRLAGEYAYAARTWVCDHVASLIGASVVEEVHNHHNFAWHEEHDGENYWVIRKGATPAYPGQLGFVGASMCEDAAIVEGVDTDESVYTMHSTVHGAGRVMSRRVAKQSLDVRKSLVGSGRVELRGGSLDELPECYKRLDDVLQAHNNCVKVVNRLTPIGVAMDGKLFT